MKDGIYLGTPIATNSGVQSRPMWAVKGERYDEYWPHARGGSAVPDNAEREWVFVADLPPAFEEPTTPNAYVLLDDGSTAHKGWDQDWIVYPTWWPHSRDAANICPPGQAMRWTDIAHRVTRIIWDGERN